MFLDRLSLTLALLTLFQVFIFTLFPKVIYRTTTARAVAFPAQGGTGEEREHKQMDADDNNYKLIEQIGQEYWGVKWSPRKIDTWCKGSQWTRKSLRRRRGCTGWSNAVRRQVTTEGVEATMVPDDSTARVMG
ncbi:hypothetical protein B0H16DRAFT_1464935 [Mycena metata]|uniref:Uncharacterized protein n=1 Tax=Mycena metata TaxID=1033252 RepID=A0AAD7ID33_9AGAR|nr:hypothetical protein B0H16DRAFT_1464935 [Mycena metata]